MKRIILLISVTIVFYCCSSPDKKTEDTNTNNPIGVQDGTGNVPDTSNAINLSTHKKDTTQNPKDSIK